MDHLSTLTLSTSTYPRKLALLASVCAALAVTFSNSGQAQASDCASCAMAGATRGSAEASTQMSMGAGIIVLGGASMLAGSGKLMVESVKGVADGVIVTLKTVANASNVTLQLSGKVLQQVALVSGTVVEVSAVSTGYLLVAAGQAIAFIPNEVGMSLLHHRRAQ